MSNKQTKDKKKSKATLQVKKLFKESWPAFRRKYFLNVLIVFVVGIIAGGYSLSTRIGTLGSNINDPTVIEAQVIADRATGRSNADSIEDFLSSMEIVKINPDSLTLGQQYTKGALSVFVNQISTSGSLVYGILNGVNMLVFKGSIGRSLISTSGTSST